MKIFIGMRFFSTLLFLFAIFSLVCFSAKQVYAVGGIYKKINFQGKLVNANGTNVANGNKSVVFTIYDADSGGNNLWDETQTVSVTDGIFRVALGDNDPSINSINFNSDALYLGIKVEADAEMTPRIRLSSVPYAFNADKLNGVTATQSASGFTLTGGSSTPKTLTLNDNITLGLTIQPTSANGLTIQSNGANVLTLDTGGSASLDIGKLNASGITLGQSGITTTIDSALTVTSGRTFTFNTDAFTDLTGNGLAVSSNALIVNLTSSGNTGLTTSNSGLEVGSSGLTLLKGCNDGQLLEYSDAGGWACADDDSIAGGGTNWTVRNGTIHPHNNTLDVLFGGDSTSSAKFAFLNMSGGSGLEPLASFSGNLRLTQRTNSLTPFSKTTQTEPGQIASGGTSLIASVSASAVYNGSLYVGTGRGSLGGAEVYRYTSGTTWTKITDSTPGTIINGGTSNIASVSAMAVHNGKLYIGTTKTNGAEIYRYDGNSWTKVTQAAGTIRAGGTANIDGISSMTVVRGVLYAGTMETNSAQVYKYDGGQSWTVMNTTAGRFDATNKFTAAVTSMTSYNNTLYIGTMRGNQAEVYRLIGLSTATAFTLVSAATGTICTSANVSAVTAMTVYNGNLMIGTWNPTTGAEVCRYEDGNGSAGTLSTSWKRLNNNSGVITFGGTSSIPGVLSMTVYNGRLYIGTEKLNAAEVYEYNDGDNWIVRSNAAGQLASAGTSNIDKVTTLIPYNDFLYAGTAEVNPTTTTAAEVYSFKKVTDQSYALKFQSAVQNTHDINSPLNEGNIAFMASASANHQGTGSFLFSHGIQTRNGFYDIAEDYPTRDDSLTPGDLVSIDPSEKSFVKKSEGLNDDAIIGIYSENPALRLSQPDASIDGAKAIPVALAGRVEVKVSSENGPIKPGDYLTSSSIPGHAMKAKKSGLIIGQAMESFISEGENNTGKILAYIKSSSYFGSIAESFAGLTPSEANSRDILGALLSEDKGLENSEFITDRLVAGLEIITPNITADTIFARKIRAEQIEGLEFILSKLTSQTGVLSASQSPALSDIVQQAPVLREEIGVSLAQLQGLEIKGNATISADLRVQGNTLVEGVLSVIDTLRSTNFIATGLSDFFGIVNFRDNVLFKGRPTFNSDTAGYAVIKKGAQYVDIAFSTEYEHIPVINANITIDLPTKAPDQSDADYNTRQSEDESRILSDQYSFIITRKTTKGFRIILDKTTNGDLTFSWLAIAVDKPIKSESQENSAPGITPSISASPAREEELPEDITADQIIINE